MKAGIAVSMLALRALHELEGHNLPRVTMLWTTDEEVGSETSRADIEALARECSAVLVLEPSLPGGAVKTSRKGCGEFELTVHGVSAHAGLDPGKGASAIHELAHQIVAITALQNPDAGRHVQRRAHRRWFAHQRRRRRRAREHRRARPDAWRTRQSSRGSCGRCVLCWRERGSSSRVASIGRRSNATPAVIRLYGVARDVAGELGKDLPEGAAGGGSDGNFTAAIGVPTLDGLGPRGDGAHALHEYVELDDLAWRAAFIARLLSRLGRETPLAMPNGVKTVLLLGALSGLLLVIGDVLGGANGLMIGLVFAAVMNIGSYWFSDKIVLRMYSAQEVGAEHPLYRVTERLARQAGLPMPKVYVIPDPSPNAFATGRNPAARRCGRDAGHPAGPERT